MALPLIPLALSLAQFAPSVMRFFGAGEASTAVAQQVVDIAQTVSGATTPQKALEAIRADVQLQFAFQKRVLELDHELERAYLADRQDARQRDVDVRRLTGGSNTRADVMVAGAVAGLIACLVCLVWFRQGMPGEAVGIISTVAGIFGACLRDAFQFEFGSSRGSRTKDDLLASLQNNSK
jgi:hypothetical protein